MLVKHLRHFSIHGVREQHQQLPIPAKNELGKVLGLLEPKPLKILSSGFCLCTEALEFHMLVGSAEVTPYPQNYV